MKFKVIGFIGTYNFELWQRRVKDLFIASTKFTENVAWDKCEWHREYQLDRDEGECHMINSLMCFRRGDGSYPRSDDVEGDFGQTGESV